MSTSPFPLSLPQRPLTRSYLLACNTLAKWEANPTLRRFQLTAPLLASLQEVWHVWRHAGQRLPMNVITVRDSSARSFEYLENGPLRDEIELVAYFLLPSPLPLYVVRVDDSSLMATLCCSAPPSPPRKTFGVLPTPTNVLEADFPLDYTYQFAHFHDTIVQAIDASLADEDPCRAAYQVNATLSSLEWNDQLVFTSDAFTPGTAPLLPLTSPYWLRSSGCRQSRDALSCSE